MTFTPDRSSGSRPGVLFISHDAWRTGAPMILLHLQRWLKQHTDVPFVTILRAGAGELRPDFEALGPVIAWDELPAIAPTMRDRTLPQSRAGLLEWLRRANVGLIYSNTITNGELLEALHAAECPVVTHVHELEYWIRHRLDPAHLEQAWRHSSVFIAVSQAVKKNLVENVGVAASKVEVVHEFVPDMTRVRTESAASLRGRLGIPAQAILIGASGTTDWRKGPDLFVQLAAIMRRRRPDQSAHFLWVGGERAGSDFAALWHDVVRTEIADRVHFVGAQSNSLDYFAALDVFALTSREDPFPLVCLEAASLGKPIVCFDRSGGIGEFVRSDAGFTVPYLDLEAMAEAIERLIDDPGLREQHGKVAATRARDEHHIDVIAPRLLSVIERHMASSRPRGDTAHGPDETGRAIGSTDLSRPKVLAAQARVIAFYLPQFHPIPENDAWWGPGFTEWRNVVAARPLFNGHTQPDLPSDLGFYDLRLPETRQAQADLARSHGIHGFCYYHYWFNGRRLLERPFNEVLISGRPDFPFCLCWANENWTRAWDGHDQDVLIGQSYSLEDDVEHMRWLAAAFRDPRYIRVDDKPLFLVYRISRLPNPARTAEIWREEAHRLGIGDIFLATVESLRDDRIDPTTIGFDGAVEFQPDWLDLGDPLFTTGNGNKVYSYGSLIERALAKPSPSYRRFSCVATDWDNAARRRENATTFVESTPEGYGYWLQRTIEASAHERESPLVFVNAWNEWAEGAHLEPNQSWGRRYLEATRAVLSGKQGRSQVPVNPPLSVPRTSASTHAQAGSFFGASEGRRQDREALAAARREVEAFRQSLSWRVTGPLRAGYERILKLRQWIERIDKTGQ